MQTGQCTLSKHHATRDPKPFLRFLEHSGVWYPEPSTQAFTVHFALLLQVYRGPGPSSFEWVIALLLLALNRKRKGE